MGTITSNGQPNGASPTYQIAYSATQVGQVESIIVCAQFCSATDVYVGFQGYGALTATANMTLIGANSVHPLNHFATPNTLAAINLIVNAYALGYGTASGYQVVGVNDISLTGGGMFDLHQDWTVPHNQHNYGLAVDFRANNKPNSVLPEAYNTFIQHCRNVGLGRLAYLELPGTSEQHIHCDGN